jgi:hypothetical protein
LTSDKGEIKLIDGRRIAENYPHRQLQASTE